MVKLRKASSKQIKPTEEDGMDRISNLPDALISKILSLLPTENAVATSALSKRWKFLWTSITSLNFLQGHPKRRVMKKTKFTLFVNRVIMLITPPCVHKFRLNFTHLLFDPTYLDMWISVIAQTVRELDLDLHLYENPFELQVNNFRFNKLVYLKLEGDIHFNIPSQSKVCLPNLQTLHLAHIRFSIASDSSVSFPNLIILHFNVVINYNGESFQKLYSSCPVLQELYIQDLHIRNRYLITNHISFYTPSLTSLQLVKMVGAVIEFKIPPKVFVCFPNLQQLHLSHITFSIANDSSISLPNLKILHVCYIGNYENQESVQKLISSCPLLNDLSIRIEGLKDSPRLLIRIPSLPKLQLLSISGQALKAIENAFSDFHNLKRLVLDVDDCSQLTLVIDNLLECMDNLEHLAITMNYQSCSCANMSWSQPLNMPKGLAWCVTTISFDKLSGDCHYQLEFLRYILENARALQVLKLSTNQGSEKRKQLVKKVSKFPKESQACQVKFT